MACLKKCFIIKEKKSYFLPRISVNGSTRTKTSNRQEENGIQKTVEINEKNFRTESGFKSLDGNISTEDKLSNIPPPPQRTPPLPPIPKQQQKANDIKDSSKMSPIPSRKPHKTTIPDINFIKATPSPIPKRHHNEMIESRINIIDELNIVSNSSSDRNIRKKGVISDKINHKETINIQISVFLKDKQSIEMIKDAILANDFLSNIITEDTIKTVIDAMTPRYYIEDSFIIKEGDTGSHFYVSAEGKFQVIKDGKILKTFGEGLVFGELAILYKAKRFASIKSLTSTKVWVLERKVFQKIMIRSGRKEQEENIKFLKSVADLQDLASPILVKISDLLKREFYPPGSTIIRQGDVGDKFYIIRGGSVNVVKRNELGEEKLVGILKRGACFGEQALLHQEKRLASVIANVPGTECLTLDRIAFDNFLGSLETIKNIKVVDRDFKISASNIEISNGQVKTEFSYVELNELRIIGTLGVGGFGQVFLVQHNNKETFALKRLKKIDMVQQQQQEHAYSEKEVMFACNSPFIVRLYKTYRDNKYLYFLMESCMGGDLWTVLQKHKYFDEKTAKFMTACVVEALSYLHSRNMIYRDLKPENLMLDERGYIKLVDFGFAKIIKPSQKTWTFAGTPEYVAPEIIQNKGHDRAVDYWALGVFIHELLIGKPPFRGKDYVKTYNLILRGIDSIQLSQKIPRKAQLIIKRLCRQTPTERLGYQKNGVNDIRNHTWYSGFEWEKLRSLKMVAPFVPTVKSNTDLSNFDEYPVKDREEPPDETSGWDKDF